MDYWPVHGAALTIKMLGSSSLPFQGCRSKTQAALQTEMLPISHTSSNGRLLLTDVSARTSLSSPLTLDKHTASYSTYRSMTATSTTWAGRTPDSNLREDLTC